MGARWQDIGQVDEGRGAIDNPRYLMIPGMATGRRRIKPGNDFEVSLDRFETAAVGRNNFLGVSVGGMQALVAGVLRDLQLALLQKDLGTRKCGFERSRFLSTHQTAAVVKVKMRYDHPGDVTEFQPECAQVVGEPSVAMAENFAFHRVQAIADPRIDDDRFAAPQDQRTSQVEPDAIQVVGRMLTLPELTRHYAEHASAVVAPEPIGEKGNLERTDLERWRGLSHP